MRQNRKIRTEFKKLEVERLKHKVLRNNQVLPLKVREMSSLELSRLKGSFPRIKNKCLLTNRSRGLILEFGVSRIVFKNWGDQGELGGIRRSSW